MQRHWYIKWEPDRWIRDTRHLSAEAKGVLIDVLMFAHGEPNRGVYTRSKEVMAREVGIPLERLDNALRELSQALRVTVRNKKVTLVNRRMVREQNEASNNAKRQARFRAKQKSNAPITPYSHSNSNKEDDYHHLLAEVTAPKTATEIPKALQGLELFEGCPELVQRYAELHREWSRAYTKVDIGAELRRVHARIKTSSRPVNNMVGYIAAAMANADAKGGVFGY